MSTLVQRAGWEACKACATTRPTEKLTVSSESTTVDGGDPKVTKSYVCQDAVWCAEQQVRKAANIAKHIAAIEAETAPKVAAVENEDPKVQP